MNAHESNRSTVDKSPTAPGITRRSFIKRTSSTAVVTVLALHALRAESWADEAAGSGSGEIRHILVLGTWPNYMEFENPFDLHPRIVPKKTEDGTPEWYITESSVTSVHDDGDDDKTFIIKIKTTPTSSFTQTLFPTSQDRWGVFATSFSFGFTGLVTFHPVTKNPDGTETRGQSVASAPISHTGTASINEKTGVITKDPTGLQAPSITNGTLHTGENYRVSIVKTEKSVIVLVYVAHQKDHDNPEQLEAGIRAGGASQTNTYGYDSDFYIKK